VDELLLSFDDRKPKEMLEEVRKKESHLLRYQQRSKALSSELEAAMEVNRAWESYERNLEVTKNLRTELKSIRAKIEPLIQGLKSFKVSNYKKELEELREAARGLQANYSEQQAQFLSAKSEYSKLQTLINEGGKCPTCSSQIHDPKKLKATADKLSNSIGGMLNEKSSIQSSSTKIQRGIEEVELKVRDYEGRRADVEQMKTVFNAKKASLDFIRVEEPSSPRKDLNQLREESNSVGEKMFEAQKFIQSQKALLRQFKSLREKLNEAKESLTAVEGKYLLVKWMFDNLPVMKLRFIDQNKVTVENLINEELSKMGLPFIVQIDTQRSLSKGTRIKDEFTFKIINVHSSKEAHHDDLSGGEEVCVLLATQFAINQVSRTNLGFEIYDEIYGPLDKGNKSIVIEGLKERARSKQVLSVSHDDEITHSFDTIISIFKVEGKSRVKGQVYGEE
jgi:chromosome segregation ATPase